MTDGVGSTQPITSVVEIGSIPEKSDFQYEKDGKF